MKTNILILFILCLGFNAMSQSQADAFIKEAQGYLSKKEYKQAVLSLQDAINDINNVLAEQIAQTLPAEINDLKAEGENNINTAPMGMMGGGIQISKSYKHPSKKENDADVQLMTNAQMMSAVNMYITNPAMLGQGHKSVRVGSYRAILKSETQDFYDDNGGSKPIRSTEIQIPLTQTLITLNLRGFASEAEEIAFATKLEVDKIKVALGE